MDNVKGLAHFPTLFDSKYNILHILVTHIPKSLSTLIQKGEIEFILWKEMLFFFPPTWLHFFKIV